MNPFPTGAEERYRAQSSGKLCQITDTVFFNNAAANAYTGANTVGVFNASNNNVLATTSPIVLIQRGANVTNGSQIVQPVIRLDPRAAGDAVTSVGTAPANSFYTPAKYRGAFGANENWAHGFLQRKIFFRLHFFDQVHQHFRIGFADKRMAVFLKRAAQHRVIFDNSVVDQRQTAIAADVRVGVDVVGLAVRSPACMADADTAGDVLVFRVFDQFGYFAFFLIDVQAAVKQGHAGAVVAPVFQSLQTLDQDWVGHFRPDISDNSAHILNG